MIPRKSEKTNKSSHPSLSFDVPVNTDYQPEVGSALEAVHEQGRGTALNERNQSDIRKHDHDGSNSRKIEVSHIAGFIRTVTAAPDWTPRNFFEQFALYSNGGTYRLYAYDTLDQAWRLVALT